MHSHHLPSLRALSAFASAGAHCGTAASGPRHSQYHDLLRNKGTTSNTGTVTSGERRVRQHTHVPMVLTFGRLGGPLASAPPWCVRPSSRTTSHRARAVWGVSLMGECVCGVCPSVSCAEQTATWAFTPPTWKARRSGRRCNVPTEGASCMHSQLSIRNRRSPATS